MKLLAVATQGPGSNDELRLHSLLSELEPDMHSFDPRRRIRSALRLFGHLRAERPELVVMEGTGVGGGIPLLAARMTLGTRYVVSTGDAVAPFMAGRRRSLGAPFLAYEYALLHCSAAVIGWSPYLVGRALTFGAPRAITAAGWAPFDDTTRYEELRKNARDRWGVPRDALVFGIVGSLKFNRRYSYCYGLELVRAMRMTSRADLRVVVVGDGDGRSSLRRAGADDERLILAGAVSRDSVPEALAGFDVASLPQSVDGVGSFRYTTKLSEYLAAGLPVVTGQIPAAYDLDDGWLWRLEGDSPWADCYVSALAQLMQQLTSYEVGQRRDQVPRSLATFDESRQRRRVTALVKELTTL